MLGTQSTSAFTYKFSIFKN
jgi:hypothetical protein